MFFCSCNNANSDANVLEEYYSDGTLKSSIEQDEQGLKHGVQKTFWENGSIKGEYGWSHGVADGTVREYSDDGKLISVGHFTNGQQDSTEVQYYSDGTIKANCEYAEGMVNGRCTFYYPNGKVKLLAAQKDDKTIWFIHYDSLSGKSDDYRVPPSSVTPDTLSITSATPLSVTFEESDLAQYFSVSRIDFYKNQEALAKREVAFSCTARVESGALVFELPSGISSGKWVLDVVLLMPDATPDNMGFGLTRTIEIVK